MHNPRPMCAVETCNIPNRHVDDDHDHSACRGCLPGLAADGLRLCTHHTHRLGPDLLILAARYRQLALTLAGAGQSGERTSGGNRNPNINLNLRAVAVRRDIEALLSRLARLITSQRGFGWPMDTATTVVERPYGFIGPMPAITRASHTYRVPPLAKLCARSADWLAAHDRAGEYSAAISDLVGQAFRTAFPTGTRMFELPGLNGERFLACTHAIDDEENPGGKKPCPGYLWTIVRKDGDRLPSQIMCNADDKHQWPSTQWVKFGKQLLKEAA